MPRYCKNTAKMVKHCKMHSENVWKFSVKLQFKLMEIYQPNDRNTKSFACSISVGISWKKC